MIYARFVKRPLDLLFAALALVALSPLLLVLAVLVRVRLGRPVLFRQTRPGLHGRTFVLRKFRTMTDAQDARGRLLPDSARLTPFGAALRARSLDELPELWNILLGQMSFVGPRPLLVEYLPLYTDRQKRRHDVRPGLTGLAQTSGRNALDWGDRFALDVTYVERVTFLGDLRILARTVAQVLRREGIRQPGEATMRPYQGSTEGAA